MDDKKIHEADNPDWKYCPICGKELPNVPNVKFCTKCGIDLNYIKQHNAISPNQVHKSQNSIVKYHSDYVSKKSEKIKDENLVNNKDHELWSPGASIGLSMAAFMMMNIIVGGIFAVLAFILLPFDINSLIEFATNPYFISISLIFELILIFIPLLYVGKYIENPTLKNRLILLGFTTRGYDWKKIIKEILIGLTFAIVAIGVVIGLSVAIELLLRLFGVIIIDSGEPASLVIPSDIPSLVFFSLIMILVIGTSEEILFRGFMQKGLVRRLGSKVGILITALIFSMIHVVTIFLVPFDSIFFIVINFILLFVPYFAISLLLGLIYHWRRENLIAVMITHGFYDVLTILMAYLVYVVY
ncbi:MAG: type II CAAX prenyl endopeptidase Rce1 family protein [Candidatus Heimdallarchaeota archaeon]